MAHRHSLNINKATNDTSVTLHVDVIEKINLAPFLLIEEPNTRLKVTVEVVE